MNFIEEPVSTENHKSRRILVHFNIRKNEIQEIDSGHHNIIKDHGDEYLVLKKQGDTCYELFYHKKDRLLVIRKYTKGYLTIYDDEFWCTAPINKGDVIYVDCNGIRANIYAWEK